MQGENMESNACVSVTSPRVLRAADSSGRPLFPRRTDDKLVEKAELLRSTQGECLGRINSFVFALPPDLQDKAGRAKLRALESWDGREKFGGVFAAMLPYDILANHGEKLTASMTAPERAAA
jgi:hypothetical protein